MSIIGEKNLNDVGFSKFKEQFAEEIEKQALTPDYNKWPQIPDYNKDEDENDP